ncbi:YncE family protein, partial [candidate division WOR-3 bacterium]|nr:YncE family protein [candidate division WOR-3 bacterium]
MRRPILLWSALLAAFAAGQQLEATVYLPDSIIGVWDPRCLAVGAGRLVVGGAGEALVAVDCRSGARAGRLEFPFTVEAMAANPAGTRVFCAIAGEEMPPDSSTVFVVDPATMERTGALRAGRDPVALCVSRRHDRMYCVSRDDARLTLVSGDGETLLGSTAVRPNPVGLAYSEQLDRIYVRHWQDRWLTVADGGGAVLDSVDIGQYPSGAVLDERTQRLYVTYGSNLAVLNCSTGLVESRVFVGRFPVDVALDTTHDRLFLALNYSDAVAAVDCRTGQPVGQVGVGDSPTRLLWLPGADALLCANYLGSSVSVIDPAGLAVRSTIRTRHRPAMVLPDPDGARAWVAHEDDAAVSVLEPDSGTVVACYLLWEEPMAVGWNGSTRMLYCLTRQRRLYAVDGSARTVHFGVDVADGPVGLATDSAGAKVYVATGPDSLVTVYDGSSGVVLSRVKVGAQPTCLAGNPIDRKVYCCRRSRMQIIDAVVDSVRWGVSSVTN